MKNLTAAFSILLLVFISCESPHDKSTRRHLTEILSQSSNIAYEYRKYQEIELDQVESGNNQYFLSIESNLASLIENQKTIYPTGKYKKMDELTTSILELSATYFEVRRKMVIMMHTLEELADTYRENLIEHNELKGAASYTSSSFAGFYIAKLKQVERKLGSGKSKMKNLIELKIF